MDEHVGKSAPRIFRRLPRAQFILSAPRKGYGVPVLPVYHDRSDDYSAGIRRSLFMRINHCVEWKKGGTKRENADPCSLVGMFTVGVPGFFSGIGRQSGDARLDVWFRRAIPRKLAWNRAAPRRSRKESINPRARLKSTENSIARGKRRHVHVR